MKIQVAFYWKKKLTATKIKKRKVCNVLSNHSESKKFEAVVLFLIILAMYFLNTQMIDSENIEIQSFKRMT